MNRLRGAEWLGALALIVCAQQLLAADALKVHGIFRSNMVLQRDKPITVWGWAPVGSEVQVSFGKMSSAGEAKGDNRAMGGGF